MTWLKVADDAPTASLNSPFHPSRSTVTGGCEPRDPLQPIPRECGARSLKRLRHMRTRASLKIASVIQPGRRWDSPAKLTSPIFLHTFSENNGIFQVEGGSGGLSRYIGLVITCGRRWTWTHGKTAFREADWKGGALKIMDVCALCNLLAATASSLQENRITDATECLARPAGLFIDTWSAIKQIGIQLAR